MHNVCMRNHPEYELVEFFLAGLFIAASAAALIWAINNALSLNGLGTVEGTGLVLMFLGGAVHPRKFVFDSLTFPLSFVSGSGRESPLTVIAAWLGCLLWGSAVGYRWLFGGG